LAQNIRECLTYVFKTSAAFKYSWIVTATHWDPDKSQKHPKTKPLVFNGLFNDFNDIYDRFSKRYINYYHLSHDDV